MIKHLLLLTAIWFVYSGQTLVFANDNPCTAFTLSVGTSFSGTTANNTGATNSSVPDATCDGGSSAGDIWYTALVGSNGTLIIETRTGSLADIGMALYTGPNCSTLTLHSCIAGGTPGHPSMPYRLLTGMTPGTRIYIRLWDVDNDETGSFTISAYVNCSASVSVTGPSSGCSSSSHQLCATAGFTTYNWTGGLATACINVNSTGTYVVTATDADGCTASASHSFTSLTSPTVSTTGPSSACSANNPQICVPTGFANYSWSNGGTTNCINPTSTGAYGITVTAGNGCTASATHLISVYTSPSISITGPASKCSGTGTQICAPSGYSSYSWSSSATTNCITPTSTGTYTVTVSDVQGCTGTDSHHITVNTSPVVSITGPSNACPGTNPQFCISGSFSSYSWSSGATTNCINPQSTGSYTATVTDAFGCTGTQSKSITYYPAPSVSITGPTSNCTGTPIQLCATSGFTSYAWSNGGTTSCITTTTSGTFTVIATDDNGCTTSSSHVVSINSAPSSAITGPASVCNGGTAQLCAPAGHASYLWSNNSTSSCLTVSASGTYTVTVTGNNGCTSSSSHSFTVHPQFAMSITGPSNACSGTNPQLCASNGTYTYLWSTGATTACISPSVSGTYSVVATNSNGCTRSASKGFTVYSPLNANITGPSTACNGTTVQLCATSGNVTYAWSGGQTTGCINVSNDGTYSVVITDINNCTATASKTVTFSSSFVVDITGPVSGCIGNSAQLCAPPGYISYAWNTGATSECITTTTAGTYSVTVEDQVGCVANGNYNLPFNPPPAVNISGPTIICTGSLATWCATPGFSSYLWSNGGNGDCINVSQDTVYSVQVTDGNGCSSSVSAALEVVQIVPNIFESGGLLICDTFNPRYRYEWLLNGLSNGCADDTCTPSFSGTYTVIVSDTISGCVESGTYNYVVTGISSVRKGDITLFPNPFSENRFDIRFSDMEAEKISVTVTDALGKIAYYDEWKIDSHNEVRQVLLDSVRPGIYFVTIRTGSGILRRQVIAN